MRVKRGALAKLAINPILYCSLKTLTRSKKRGSENIHVEDLTSETSVHLVKELSPHQRTAEGGKSRSTVKLMLY